MLKFSALTGNLKMPSEGDSKLGLPRKKLLPMPRILVLASLSLVRLTSTKRISVCTWLGSVGSSEGDSDWLVSAEVALPLTNTMLWRGVVEQPVHTIRLVAPLPTPVSRKWRSPLTRTSAIFGSPMARRVIATGDCSSVCKPSPTSITAGNWPRALQLPDAPIAMPRGRHGSIKAKAN